jgi:hypothetical protein
MQGKWRQLVLLLGSLVFARVMPSCLEAQTAVTEVFFVPSQLPDSDQMNVIVEFDEFTNVNGTMPSTNNLQGEITAITNRGTNVPFAALETNGIIQLYRFLATPPPDSLAETYTLYGTNGSTDVILEIPPFFPVLPQNQSVFVGSNVTFSAQAIHTTGFQWLKDGTVLIDDGHFSGTTNKTLSIANVSLADAGPYSIVAAHPTSPRTNSATLAVFKPIQLSLMQIGPALARLLAGNADQSPFEQERLSNVVFYSNGDVAQSVSNWTLCTNLVLLTNGVLQIDIPTASYSNQFWIAVEHP